MPEPHVPETAHSVKTRAISGVKVLAARTLVSVLLRVVSSLVLARLLFPQDYGLFGVASYITGLGMFLTDVGLASALVRQETKPTRNEAFTVFCTQQIITLLVVSTILASTPLLVHVYVLSPSAQTLLYVMAGGLFLSSLRVVPMIALERNLQFTVIARCELIENLVQTAGTIALAYLGCGAWALAGGGLLRGGIGLVLVWGASPWRPAGHFELAIVKRLAKFGLTYQLNAIIPILFGGWMPLVVGRILGVAAVGLVGWATNLASVPMMLSGVLSRVSFPTYSRLQFDPDALNHYLRSSIRRINVSLCLVIPLAIIIYPLLIPVVFQSRWVAAIPLVQWFSLECIILTVLGLVASAQNALGYAGDRLAITVGMGAVRWSVGFATVKHFGLIGIGPAMFAVSSIDMFITISVLKRRFHLSQGLLFEVFQPILIMLVVLLISLGAGYCVDRNSVLTKTLIALFSFSVLTSLIELSNRSRPLTRELTGMIRMLRPAHN